MPIWLTYFVLWAKASDKGIESPLHHGDVLAIAAVICADGVGRLWLARRRTEPHGVLTFVLCVMIGLALLSSVLFMLCVIVTVNRAFTNACSGIFFGGACLLDLLCVMLTRPASLS